MLLKWKCIKQELCALRTNKTKVLRCVEQKKKVFSAIGSWICPYTAKQRPKKVYQKSNYLFFMCKSDKVTKVQSVLKTDQGAVVSAHAFFSAVLVDLFWCFFAVCGQIQLPIGLKWKWKVNPKKCINTITENIYNIIYIYIYIYIYIHSSE